MNYCLAWHTIWPEECFKCTWKEFLFCWCGVFDKVFIRPGFSSVLLYIHIRVCVCAHACVCVCVCMCVSIKFPFTSFVHYWRSGIDVADDICWLMYFFIQFYHLLIFIYFKTLLLASYVFIVYLHIALIYFTIIDIKYYYLYLQFLS